MGNFQIDPARPVGPAAPGEETNGLQENRFGVQQPERTGGEEENELFVTRSEDSERTAGLEREEPPVLEAQEDQLDNRSILLGANAQERAPEDLPGRIVDILV